VYEESSVLNHLAELEQLQVMLVQEYQVGTLKASLDPAQPGTDNRGQIARKWYIVQCTAMTVLPVVCIHMGVLSILILQQQTLILNRANQCNYKK